MRSTSILRGWIAVALVAGFATAAAAEPGPDSTAAPRRPRPTASAPT